METPKITKQYLATTKIDPEKPLLVSKELTYFLIYGLYGALTDPFRRNPQKKMVNIPDVLYFTGMDDPKKKVPPKKFTVNSANRRYPSFARDEAPTYIANRIILRKLLEIYISINSLWRNSRRNKELGSDENYYRYGIDEIMTELLPKTFKCLTLGKFDPQTVMKREGLRDNIVDVIFSIIGDPETYSLVDARNALKEIKTQVELIDSLKIFDPYNFEVEDLESIIDCNISPLSSEKITPEIKAQVKHDTESVQTYHGEYRII